MECLRNLYSNWVQTLSHTMYNCWNFHSTVFLSTTAIYLTSSKLSICTYKPKSRKQKSKVQGNFSQNCLRFPLNDFPYLEPDFSLKPPQMSWNMIFASFAWKNIISLGSYLFAFQAKNSLSKNPGWIINCLIQFPSIIFNHTTMHWLFSNTYRQIFFFNLHLI